MHATQLKNRHGGGALLNRKSRSLWMYRALIPAALLPLVAEGARAFALGSGDLPIASSLRLLCDLQALTLGLAAAVGGLGLVLALSFFRSDMGRWSTLVVGAVLSIATVLTHPFGPSPEEVTRQTQGEAARVIHQLDAFHVRYRRYPARRSVPLPDHAIYPDWSYSKRFDNFTLVVSFPAKPLTRRTLEYNSASRQWKISVTPQIAFRP